ncbi:MAG: hypothetical protein GY870_18330 [archaeon]|nr:hypothetical protein [archaeon]
MNSWETRREKIIRLLEESPGLTFDLKSLMIELEYSNKRVFLEDIRSISIKIRNKGQKMEFLPASCSVCDFLFYDKEKKIKIPSKCPKCHNQRIN